ncbi:hypothetical protein RN2511_042280 [Rhodococcus sp. NKCM2511]|uniref:hypothetical protein n=1 Tax=Rhodococcus sp. NKCM2511 TaxID=2766011 RepID=UPI001910C137|nr:hypothetical protein [Rhodococcus sp. NKCM2511]GHP19492.1 hypothetical protein RN2511_042280 [Rhodococcus sp. NKCM2511]
MRLAETTEKPLATFEINEDGTVKTSPVFPKWKQDAWERYIANGGDLTMEDWSRKYDQLRRTSGTAPSGTSRWEICSGAARRTATLGVHRDPKGVCEGLWGSSASMRRSRCHVDSSTAKVYAADS